MAANEYLDRCDSFTLLMPTDGGVASPANPAYVAGPAFAPDPDGDIGSGDPLIWGLGNSPTGSVPLVAQENYNPPGQSTPTGNISVKRIGANFFNVIAKRGVNGVNRAINPGDPVYANPTALDTTSGIASGIQLTADDVSGWFFGHAMSAVAAGQTAEIAVMIGWKQ